MCEILKISKQLISVVGLNKSLVPILKYKVPNSLVRVFCIISIATCLGSITAYSYTQSIDLESIRSDTYLSFAGVQMILIYIDFIRSSDIIQYVLLSLEKIVLSSK